MKRGDKKMEKIIAGLVQMDSGPDMNENMRMAEQYVREAAEQGAKLILFPETAEYTGADMPGHASAVPGYVSRRPCQTVRCLSALRQHDGTAPSGASVQHVVSVRTRWRNDCRIQQNTYV